MSAITTRQTPANYIHFASQNMRGITPQEYRGHLMSLLLNSWDKAAQTFNAFKVAANSNANLRSTFYTAVHLAFEQIRHVSHETPLRWNGLMDAIAGQSKEDETLAKYIRTALLGKTVPILVGPKSTSVEMEIASDILAESARYPHLQDAILPQSVRPVVLWHLKNAGHKFEIVAPRFAELRESAPFAEMITTVENLHDVHVDSTPLPHDTKKNLVLKFGKAHGTLNIWVVDLSKPSRAMHPHDISFDEANHKYHETFQQMLLAATELDDQPWVEPIATEAYCRLG